MRRTDSRPDRPRVFGIGLNKTGTTSFHEAMTILGLESLHWGGPEIAAKVQAAIDDEKPLLSNLDPRYEVFSDIGLIARRFAMADRQYPGSRFVYTVRPVDDWIDSRIRHVRRNVERKARGEYTGTFLVVEEAKWREEWEAHAERVHRYFEGRDDFLEIDITREAGWEPFCELLGLPVPDVPFPWVNRHRDAPARRDVERSS